MSSTASVARNDPCPCGSGKKYKKCCMLQGGVQSKRRGRVALVLVAVFAVLTAAAGLWGGRHAAAIAGAIGLATVGLYLLLSNPPPPTSGGNPGAINFGR